MAKIVRVWIAGPVYQWFKKACLEKNQTPEEFVLDLVNERYEKIKG